MQALCRLASLPAQHLQQIMRPKASGQPHRSHSLAAASLPGPIRAALQQHYNESQQRAICACLSASEPFTLIQVSSTAQQSVFPSHCESLSHGMALPWMFTKSGSRSTIEAQSKATELHFA